MRLSGHVLFLVTLLFDYGRGEGYNQPQAYKSENGLLDVSLVVDMVTSLNGTRTAPGYNGRSAGPTLRVSPGDTLRVTLTNNLQTTETDAELYQYIMDPNSDYVNTTIIANRLDNIGNPWNPTYGFWGLGYANLHFHGLEVNPSVEDTKTYISNGESKTYEIKIAEDQEPGTYWYHNHVQGTTVYAYLSSLMGAIIVEGTDRDVTDAPGIEGATEVIMILSEYLKHPDGNFPMPFFPIVYSFDWSSVTNGHLAEETVYGFEQGETVLFRAVSANVDPDLIFAIEGVTFNIVAIDGVTIPTPIQATEVVIPAGGRVDFVATFEDVGTYQMIRRGWGAHIAGDEETCQLMFGGPFNCISHNIDMPLGTIEVVAASEGARTDSATGTIDLPEYSDRLKCLEERSISAKKNVSFVADDEFPLFQIPYEGEFVPPGIAFGINGALGVPTGVTDTVLENTCEEWHVEFHPAFGHPFHAHGAKFYLLAENGEPIDEIIWRDTYSSITANDIDIKICYDRINSREAVMVHCHAATHLDIGMYTFFEVKENLDQESCSSLTTVDSPQSEDDSSAMSLRATSAFAFSFFLTIAAFIYM